MNEHGYCGACNLKGLVESCKTDPCPLQEHLQFLEKKIIALKKQLALIAEYIEGDEITDELVVANGGRVPCEVSEFSDFTTKNKRILVAVKGKGSRFLTVWPEADHASGSWKYCRIKKSAMYQRKQHE
jgi:hypothetical protein